MVIKNFSNPLHTTTQFTFFFAIFCYRSSNSYIFSIESAISGQNSFTIWSNFLRAKVLTSLCCSSSSEITPAKTKTKFKSNFSHYKPTQQKKSNKHKALQMKKHYTQRFSFNNTTIFYWLYYWNYVKTKVRW